MQDQSEYELNISFSHLSSNEVGGNDSDFTVDDPEQNKTSASLPEDIMSKTAQTAVEKELLQDSLPLEALVS